MIWGLKSLEVLLRKAGDETETEMIEARTDFVGLSAVKVGSSTGGTYPGAKENPPRTQGL